MNYLNNIIVLLQNILEHIGEGGGGIPEAPNDGSAYNRKNGDWVKAEGGMTEEERQQLTVLDLKVGEIVNLVPKTWEITFNSVNDFLDTMSEAKIFTLANFAEDVQLGDKILGHIIEDESTLDFAVNVTFVSKGDEITIAGTVAANIGPELAFLFLTSMGDLVQVQVQPMS